MPAKPRWLLAIGRWRWKFVEFFRGADREREDAGGVRESGGAVSRVVRVHVVYWHSSQYGFMLRLSPKIYW